MIKMVFRGVFVGLAGECGSGGQFISTLEFLFKG